MECRRRIYHASQSSRCPSGISDHRTVPGKHSDRIDGRRPPPCHRAGFCSRNHTPNRQLPSRQDGGRRYTQRSYPRETPLLWHLQSGNRPGDRAAVVYLAPGEGHLTPPLRTGSGHASCQNLLRPSGGKIRGAVNRGFAA
ncbi:hypothetical protein D3C75_1057260 [compost metagenome]